MVEADQAGGEDLAEGKEAFVGRQTTRTYDHAKLVRSPERRGQRNLRLEPVDRERKQPSESKRNQRLSRAPLIIVAVQCTRRGFQRLKAEPMDLAFDLGPELVNEAFRRLV